MEEKIVVGKGTEYPLPGILTLPGAPAGKVPGVVLVQGSGPTDKDETVGVNKPFRDLAAGLEKQGIATIRYDKRTYAYGKRMVKENAVRSITVEEETIRDALLAARILEADPRVDAGKVYLLGHSLGGMLAPRIDAEGGNFAGIIIMAGSPRTLREIMADQSNDLVSQLGKLLQKIARKQVAKLKEKLDAVPGMTDEQAKQTKLVGSTYAWYFKEMEEHPAADYLEAISKPVLVLQGEDDFQVYPDKDFAGYERICGEKPNFTFKLYPGLNHLFMKSVYRQVKDAKKEYAVASHVDARVAADIARWIARGDVAGSRANQQKKSRNLPPDAL